MSDTLHTDYEPPDPIRNSYVDQLRADAARWRYVRDNMLRTPLWGGGDLVWWLDYTTNSDETITEVVDKLITHNAKRKAQ